MYAAVKELVDNALQINDLHTY